jgi:hypothetical protein
MADRARHHGLGARSAGERAVDQQQQPGQLQLLGHSQLHGAGQPERPRHRRVRAALQVEHQAIGGEPHTQLARAHC